MMTEFRLSSEAKCVEVIPDCGILVTVTSTSIHGEGSIVNGMAEVIPDWQKTQDDPPSVSQEVRPTIKIGLAIKAGYGKRTLKTSRKLKQTEVIPDWKGEFQLAEVKQACAKPDTSWCHPRTCIWWEN